MLKQRLSSRAKAHKHGTYRHRQAWQDGGTRSTDQGSREEYVNVERENERPEEKK